MWPSPAQGPDSNSLQVLQKSGSQKFMLALKLKPVSARLPTTKIEKKIMDSAVI